MKKTLVLLLLVIGCGTLSAQSFITFYMPGYQLSGFHAQNIRYNNVKRGDINGKINHLTFKGDGIANHFICGIDVSGVLLSLTRPGKSYYCAGFDARMGYAVSAGDGLKIGLGVDAGYRGLRYKSDTTLVDSYNYGVFGGTLVGLYSIGDAIYIMPKLSFDPIFSDQTTGTTDGLCTKFEVSAGLRFGGNFGFSITPGFEHMKFLFEDKSGSEDVIAESFIKTKYLDFGISFMFD